MLPLHIEKSSQKSFSNCYEKISKQFLKTGRQLKDEVTLYHENFRFKIRTGSIRAISGIGITASAIEEIEIN